ncbi:3-beta-hydroxysteroid dehydrogenase [Dactylonectria macrodidyma]|uniref:3-beta-hydroxysteroid dehydrogenase n=1 Tax=Dactylonectria macrodidyma TaxID=307937 RepID=A0A9P9FUP6_9HYPO|nr:3-beta-hydroxysteroid dehydrogenase [Dactylonectria macrodidyma]
MASSKVALITGGASGMGLAVAQTLAAKGWTVHILDFNQEAGVAAEQSVAGSKFHQVDVTSWTSLSVAFDAAFAQAGRLDFVFANAGVVERDNFYDTPESDGIPPEPSQKTLDVNLNSVINQSYLALHYFRRSPHKGEGASLVMTASVGGLYPSQYCPIYSASKAGVIHFMRSIAFPYHHASGIRVYATCPGTVKTNLLNDKEWTTFPTEYFTPLSQIASTVAMLVEGGDMTDAWGRTVRAGDDYGLAVEINADRFYFRDGLEFCDDAMEVVIKATSMENQLARLEEHKAKQNGSL